MLLKITGKHIREGAHQSCRFCPIANAVSELSDPHKYEATVGRDAIKIRDKKRSEPIRLGEVLHTIHLPQVAQSFISTFDRYMAVVPIEFEIDDIPAQYLRESNVPRVP